MGNWWDEHVPSRLMTWTADCGPAKALSRVIFRGMAVDGGWKSVADLACGLAIGAAEIRRLGIRYLGIDSSAFLIARAAEAGNDVRLGEMSATGLPDKSVDCAMIRHGIEYAATPEAVLAEMIRIATSAIVLILGQSPTMADQLNAGGRTPQWNCWGMRRYEDFLQSHPAHGSVGDWHWIAGFGNQGIGGGNESILLVTLRANRVTA